MNLAQLIQHNGLSLIVAKEETVTQLHTVELRSRNIDTFHAMCAKIQHAFPSVSSLVSSDAQYKLLCNNTGIAIFCSPDKATITALTTFGEEVMDSVKDSAFSALPKTDALTAVMALRDFDHTYFDRHQVVAELLPAKLISRIKEINADHLRDLPYDDRNAQVEAALSDTQCTLAREVDYMVDAIVATHQGVERTMLHALITDAATQTNAVYCDNEILESHAAQDEHFALQEMIEKCNQAANTDEARVEMLLARCDSGVKSNNDRHAVVRNHWESSSKALKKALKMTMPTLVRTGLEHAITVYDEDDINGAPIAFAGINIERTLTCAFHTRLSLSSLAYDDVEQGNSLLHVLSGAIMAQIGAFIEMKKTTMLKAAYRTLADQVVSDTPLSAIDAYQTIRDIQERVTKTLV
jgi:hypothetical protein